MNLHKEGRLTVFLVAVLLIALNILLVLYLKDLFIVKFFFQIITSVFFVFILYFFRKPDRQILINKSGILAPCDGKVVVIEEVHEPEYFNDKRIQVSIFMSPLNVHVNWYPIAGSVKLAKYHKGKHLVAWHPKSSTDNERSTVVIKSKFHDKEILVRQIAGAVARRVVCYSKENEDVSQGEELGFIKFGSRLDLFLPLDAKIKLKLDDITIGRQTVVAEF